MVKSVTLLFPGQGSQYVGMGQKLVGTPFHRFLEQADQALDFSLSSLMLEGPEEKLTLTAHTQPAILTYSYALYHQLAEKLGQWNMAVDGVLGHSVGEYAALTAAGAIDFQDAVQMVHLRGRFMQEAVPPGKGKMVAVMRVPQEKIELACQTCSREGSEAMPANYNEPGQTVISGHGEACDRVVAWLTENIETPHRCVELKVSAPFHSSLMRPAAEQLERELEKVTSWKPLQFSYVANVDARPYGVSTPPQVVRKNLTQQVARPVLWAQSMAQLPDDTLCIECGPGRVLNGLARKINPRLKVFSLDRENAWEELEKFLTSLTMEN